MSTDLSKHPPIPEQYQQILQRISERVNLPMETLIKQYYAIFNSLEEMAIQQFPSTSKDIMKHSMAAGQLYKLHYMRPTQVQRDLIYYVGLSGLKITQRGKAYSNCYFMDKIEGKWRLIRGYAEGKDVAEKYKGWPLFTFYKATLGQWPGADNYIIDNLSELIEVKRQEPNYEELNKALGVTPQTILDLWNNPSKVDSKGRTVDSDWKCIVADILREPSFFTRKDGTRGGAYTVGDTSVMAETVTREGEVLKPITVWAPVELMTYDENSKCAFYGPVTKAKRKYKDRQSGQEIEEIQLSMNCYTIRPVWAQELKSITEETV